MGLHVALHADNQTSKQLHEHHGGGNGCGGIVAGLGVWPQAQQGGGGH